ALDVKDFYHVSLWNYCAGDFENGQDKVTYCSPRKNQFWFNPVEVWGLNNTGVEKLFSDELRSGLDAYQKAARWMFIAYVVAVVATIVEIFVGVFALFSRLGSLATTIVSTVSSLFLIGFALTATILYTTLMGSFNEAVKQYNIRGSLGHNMFVVTWLAVAFSFAAGLFWLISSCCCSGRSNKIKYGDESGRKGKYERVDSPYGHRDGAAHFQSGPGYQAPHHGVPLNNVGNKPTAYEPYRTANGKDFRDIHADPDIAGIGIICAFVVTNFVNIAIAFAGLFFGMIRGLEANAIDRLVFSQLQKVSFLRVKDSRFKFWQPIMEALTLALSDQQILMGILILVTGFIKHCSISAYHFELISDLAWFSSNTNLTSLIVLQIYFSEHPSLRNWRVCSMLVLFVFLMVALALEGHRQWYDSRNCPAQCLFDEFLVKVGGEPAKSMTSSMAILIYSYSVSVAQLSKPYGFDLFFFDRLVRKMERSIATLQDSIVSSSSKGGLTSYATSVLLLPAWVFMTCVKGAFIGITAFVDSIVVSLCSDVVWFALGLWDLMALRNIPQDEIKGNENAWGFGQVVQVLLLTSIVLTFKDLYTGKSWNWPFPDRITKFIAEQSDKRARRSRKNGEHPHMSEKLDDTSTQQSQDSDDSEPAHVTLARADTEAGGRGRGITSTSTQDVPPDHTLSRRTTTATENLASRH
ncbi:MAG: hypothetical protein Q9226_006381, partial [Calogaya cf. arnoldii]